MRNELCLASKLFTSVQPELHHRIRCNSGTLICRDCLRVGRRSVAVETLAAFVILSMDEKLKTSARIHLGLLVSLGLWNHSSSLESEATPTLTM